MLTVNPSPNWTTLFSLSFALCLFSWGFCLVIWEKNSLCYPSWTESHDTPSLASWVSGYLCMSPYLAPYFLFWGCILPILLVYLELCINHIIHEVCAYIFLCSLLIISILPWNYSVASCNVNLLGEEILRLFPILSYYDISCTDVFVDIWTCI